MQQYTVWSSVSCAAKNERRSTKPKSNAQFIRKVD